VNVNGSCISKPKRKLSFRFLSGLAVNKLFCRFLVAIVKCQFNQGGLLGRLFRPVRLGKVTSRVKSQFQVFRVYWPWTGKVYLKLFMNCEKLQQKPRIQSANFSLTSFICSYVRQKIGKISLAN
jgi:hypothetical protein